MKQSLPGQQSLCFSAEVGATYPAASITAADASFDPARFSSEGCWAFCRFDSEDIPAVRMGFQRGGFNITPTAKDTDPGLLQLHLEVMTADGALLWLPTGRFPAGEVTLASAPPSASLAHDGKQIFRVQGWPSVEWFFASDDGELEVRLAAEVGAVSILPDCLLPHCVFAMWESLARTHGTVRHRDRTFAVEGVMFYDHPRVMLRENRQASRSQYLYTTLALEGGGGIFGYHALDGQGRPIGYYCFGFSLDTRGRGTFLPRALVTGPVIGSHGIPRSWQLSWEGEGTRVEADVTVHETGILRSWGSPNAPKTLDEFSILPLVLDARVKLTGQDGERRECSARGLAEYYNAELWPT